MKVRRYSKSLDQMFRLCPFAANEFHNNDARRELKGPALIGHETHGLRFAVMTGTPREEAILSATQAESIMLLDKTLAADPYFGLDFEYEKRICFDRYGNIVPEGSGEFAIVIQDRRGLVEDDITLVEDLKSGWVESDDENERHVNICGAKCEFPAHKKFRFDYFYCRSGRSGRRISWDYEYITPYEVLITGPYEASNNGSEPNRKRMLNSKVDPLLGHVREREALIRNTPPIPTPGDHCANWYGERCIFMGNICPLSPDLPAVISREIRKITVRDVLLLPPDKQVGGVFLLFQQGYPMEQITGELASLALQGVQQLKAGAGNVEEIVQTWSKLSGENVKIGDDEFGWQEQTRASVSDKDKTTALDILLTRYEEGDLTLDEVARALSPGAQSLKKISKRKHGDLQDLLLAACVEDKAIKPSFGKIKK